MGISRVLFSSKSAEWATPHAFFERVNAEFAFTVDVCANEDNAKCARFFDEQINGLTQSWNGEQVWCNPPYGRSIGQWTSKAATTMLSPEATTIVMLLPARTDTQWFHRDVMFADEIRFIAGRLHFGGAEAAAPFPSMLAIFRSGATPKPTMRGFPCK